MSSLVEESLSVSGILLGKTMGRAPELAERFTRESADLADLEVRSRMAGRWRMASVQMAFAIMPALVYWFAGYIDRAGRRGDLDRHRRRLHHAADAAVLPAAVAAVRRDRHPDLARPLPPHLRVPRPAGRHRRARGPRASCDDVRGEVRFEGVSFAYDEDGAADAARTSTSSSRPGTHAAIVGETGSGKTTLGYLVARLYDATRGAHHHRRRRRARPVLRLAGAHGRARLAGDLPLPRQRGREPALRQARRHRRGARGRPRARRRSTTSSPRCPTATTRSSASAATASRAARSSASRSPARSCATRRCSSSTRPPARSTTRPSARCRRRSTASPRAARRSPSPTACRPSATPTRSSSSTAAGSPSAAPTPSCWPCGGRYAALAARDPEPVRRLSGHRVEDDSVGSGRAPRAHPLAPGARSSSPWPPAAHARSTTVRTSQGTITTTRLANGVRHMKFRWGPVRIAPGQNTISIADNDLLPPGPGWITSFKPNLTYVDGKVPRVDVIHLHHAVWLVASRGDIRPTWAAGEEKTTSASPRASAGATARRDRWLLNHMIHNLTPAPTRVYITWEMDFVPLGAKAAQGMREVKTQWLDVDGRQRLPGLRRHAGHGPRRARHLPRRRPERLRRRPAAQHVDGRPRRHARRHRRAPASGRPVDRPEDHPRRAHGRGLPLARALLRAGGRGLVGRLDDRDAAQLARRGQEGRRALGLGHLRLAHDVVVRVDGDHAGGDDRRAGRRRRPVHDATPRSRACSPTATCPRTTTTAARRPTLPDATKLPDGPRVPTVDIAGFAYKQGDLSLHRRARPPARRQPRPAADVRQRRRARRTSSTPSPRAARRARRRPGIAFPLANGTAVFDSGELGFGPAGFTPAANRKQWQTPPTLTDGTYTYFCRIHPFMRGAFRVKG